MVVDQEVGVGMEQFTIRGCGDDSRDMHLTAVWVPRASLMQKNTNPKRMNRQGCELTMGRLTRKTISSVCR